jgi:hypothetical protein
MTSERKLAKSRKSRDNSPFTLIRENHRNNNDLKLAEGVSVELGISLEVLKHRWTRHTP